MGRQETLDQVKEVIRTSLKVDPATPLADDMALIGGDLDLDSLDLLLVTTSIEKAFQVRIPNEAVGKDAFANVRTLAEFVDAQRR